MISKRRSFLREIDALKESISLSGGKGYPTKNLKLSGHVIMYIVQNFLHQEGFSFDIPYDQISLQNIASINIYPPFHEICNFHGINSIMSSKMLKEESVMPIIELIAEAGNEGITLNLLNTKLISKRGIQGNESSSKVNTSDVHTLPEKLLFMDIICKRITFKHNDNSVQNGTLINVLVLKRYCNYSQCDGVTNASVNYRDSILLKEGLLWNYLRWILDEFNTKSFTCFDLAKLLNMKGILFIVTF